MLLRTDIRYIVLDVETTGLDRKYDEIIQIGIVEYNALGAKVQEFSSYIKPEKKETLHSIAGLITGISLDSLHDAPLWHDVRPQISHFFSTNSVIIWHSIGFDMSMLSRHTTTTTISPLTIIDTLPLAQSLYPYLPSYSLEIIAKHITDTNHEWAQFHDALTDSIITGNVFFTLIKKLESILYAFPYLWEICKRTNSWLAICLAHKQDAIHLLKDIPLFSVTIKPLPKKDTSIDLSLHKARFTGNTELISCIQSLWLENYCYAFSQHTKALLAQKRLSKIGITTPLHEQIIFDTNMLHHFFTKKQYEERERHCAVKYILHTEEKHSSYHCINRNDTIFVAAMKLHIIRPPRKKLYTHYDLFSCIENNIIDTSQHIVIWDKESVLDSWKKWKYKTHDLYHLADYIDALVYKYTFLWHKISPLQKLQNFIDIFLGIWTWECHAYCHENKVEIIKIDTIDTHLSFSKSIQLWSQYDIYLEHCKHLYAPHDMSLLEKRQDSIKTLFQNPLTITRKWANHQERFTLQAQYNYASRYDIESFFSAYTVTYLSVLDRKLPEIERLPHNLRKTPLERRQDVKVKNKPRLCLIAPSKQIAQELILSLHNSNEYKDCLLAAEQITGWAGKIIQQASWYDSYILIGSYAFCIQCAAHDIEFDTICALNIINNKDINPFTDIEYYAGTKIKKN